jgi:hypothetical protein
MTIPEKQRQREADAIARVLATRPARRRKTSWRRGGGAQILRAATGRTPTSDAGEQMTTDSRLDKMATAAKEIGDARRRELAAEIAESRAQRREAMAKADRCDAMLGEITSILAALKKHAPFIAAGLERRKMVKVNALGRRDAAALPPNTEELVRALANFSPGELSKVLAGKGAVP